VVRNVTGFMSWGGFGPAFTLVNNMVMVDCLACENRKRAKEAANRGGRSRENSSTLAPKGLFS
jgi:hypothetical protein